MDLSTIRRFLFHPLDARHTLPVKTASIAVVVALSIISGGLFLIPFFGVNLIDRKIQMKRAPTKATHVFQNTAPYQQRGLLPSPGVQVNFAQSSKVRNLKQKHQEQLKQFEQWAAQNKWGKFAPAHYDWWMFPIMKSSASYGDTYAFNRNELYGLKNDSQFMRDFRRGVDLVVKSWGWDLVNNRRVDHPASGQQWTGYGVRLGKIADSLYLLGEKDLYCKLQQFYREVCIPFHQQVEPWVAEALSHKIL